jgi:predicted aspartyl protease
MGTFHVGCKVENHTDRRRTVTVPRALVDTGSEYTWIPSKTLEKIGVNREKKDLVFTMANGQKITRSVGFAVLRVEKQFTIDEVVFGEPGDMTLLGARTLEGLTLVVDSRKKKLVAAGPLPAAVTIGRTSRSRQRIPAQVI